MMFRNRFDDDEDEDDPRDSEFTLGLGSLLGIFFGLVLLCGLFFGFGYSLGHGHTTVKHNNPSAATPETPSTTAAATPSSSNSGSSSGSKPTAQQAAPPPPAPANPNPAETATPAAGSGTQPASSKTTPAPPQQTNTHSAPPQQNANTGAAQQVFQNAVPRTPSQTASNHHYMVQVAAVSRPRDARVLVAALEGRGFHAVTRSEPGDNLMHVQIGPFNSLAAANQMRARLMADGYNAILKP